MSKRIIISGGGTGGHIYPAVAIANAIMEIDPNTEILFVGALGKMEMEKVPKAGYQIIGLPIVGIKRALTVSNLAFPFKLMSSLLKARKIVKDFSPDVAIGVGGFASGPLLLMASLLRVPTLIQEQNSYAGITNKVLSKWAKKICVAYPDMVKFFPKEKIIFTGNPVRKDILNSSDKRAIALAHFGFSAEVKTLLIVGGSLGAKSINETVLEDLTLLLEEGFQVLWQTGKGFDKSRITSLELNSGSKVKVFEFIYEMDLAYAAADVVVSRAGALAVSELCLVGKPAILVPYPFAAEDHQTQNAMSLVNQNAALMVPDSKVSIDLIDTAIQLLKNDEHGSQLSDNIKKLSKPDAANRIAHEVFKIANL